MWANLGLILGGSISSILARSRLDINISWGFTCQPEIETAIKIASIENKIDGQGVNTAIK